MSGWWVRRCVAVGVVCGVLAGCGGEAEPVATGSARSVVLEDLTVCEAVPHDLLSTTLDYHVRSYWVRHSRWYHEDTGRWTSIYNCNLLSSSDGPFDILQLSYGVGTAQLLGESRAHVPIGEFSSRYPEAEPVVLEGHEGQGWTITLANAAYVVWEYPDGYVLSVRLTTPEGAPSGVDWKLLDGWLWLGPVLRSWSR